MEQGFSPAFGSFGTSRLQPPQFYLFSMVETRLAASEDGASPVSTRVHKIAFSAACKAGLIDKLELGSRMSTGANRSRKQAVLER